MSLRNRVIGGVVAVSIGIATPIVMYFEGRENHAYIDPVGIPTICYGSTHGVRIGDYKSNRDCDALLEKELTSFAVQVHKEILIPVKPNVLAALTSFSYNVGMANFRKSTLLKKLNAGDVRGACRELPRWVYAKGKKLNGLVKRRQKEMELCLQ